MIETFSCNRCGLDAAVGHGHTHGGRRICRDCLDEINPRPLLTAPHTYADGYDPSVIDREQLAQWPASRKITWPHPLAVVDLETTGLEPDCALTEIAVVQLGDALENRDATHILVDAPPGASVAPWVREHTAWGQTPRSEWIARGAVPWRSAITRAGRLLDGRGLVAHYLPFDLRVLRRLFRLAPEDTPGREWVLGDKIERRSICTWQLSSTLLAQGLSRKEDGYPSRSLAAVCRALGVPLEHNHQALADALATAEVNRRLLTKRRANVRSKMDQ